MTVRRCSLLASFIVVSLAHLAEDSPGLPVASSDTAHTLLCTVRDTETPLDRNVGTVFVFALLSSGAMGAAHASLFHFLVTPWPSTELSLSTMGDTEATLNDSVDAVLDLAFSSLALLDQAVVLLNLR